MSSGHRRERGWGNHGLVPPRVSCVRRAISSGISSHTRGQENPGEFPSACSAGGNALRLMTTHLTPTLDEFAELAKHGNVIPVFAEFIADNETPVSTFKKLDHGGNSFLFESTEKNDVSGRFSFVGIDPRVVIKTCGAKLQIVESGIERQVEITSDPLDEVRKLMARYQFVSRPELPRFSGGAVGFLGYEAIHFFEPKVPLAERDELQLPEMIFMITGSLLIFDHRLRTLKIVANAFLDDGPLEKIYAASD